MTHLSFSRMFAQWIPLPHNHYTSFLCSYYRHKRNKILLCCFQFFLFSSAALAPFQLGFSPAWGQSPVPLLLTPGLLPACWDHGEGENKAPCSLEGGHIKHCNAGPEPLEMDFETFLSVNICGYLPPEMSAPVRGFTCAGNASSKESSCWGNEKHHLCLGNWTVKKNM